MHTSLELLAFLAGGLTVLSPCILPILPALLSASASSRNPHRPFWIVLGLCLSFALFSTIFALFKNFLGLSNEALRGTALVILTFFGITLLFPRLWEKVGSNISTFAQKLPIVSGLSGESGPVGTIVLGAALGLVWAPCAGPVLGIILTLATAQSTFLSTFILMGGYALGASIPMLLIGYGGQRLTQKVLRFRVIGAVAPKVLGVLTLGTVLGLYFNLDTVLYAHLPDAFFLSNRIEKKLVEKKREVPIEGTALADEHAPSMVSMNQKAPSSLPVEGTMPAFKG